MKVVAEKSELHKALQIIQSAVAKRSTMPILSNVLLSVGSDGFKLSASDLELTAVAGVSAKSSRNGKTTVNAKIFSDIIRELPEGEVSLHTLEGERLEITAKGAKFKIIGVSAEEFPALPGVSREVKGRISAARLLEGINRSLYAASTDETRFNLNGVCFEALPGKKGNGNNEESLNLVATDGHRLAVVTRPCGSLTFSEKIIVPRRALAEVRRILEAEAENDVGIAIEEGFFLIETKNLKISARLIDGEYPDYTQVLPKEQGKLIIVRSDVFSAALKRMMLVVTDREKGVKLNFSDGKVRITSSSPELGEASEELQLEQGGGDFTIGFNAQYLIDAISSFGEDQELRMELNGETGPARFSVSSDQSSFAIVMPMRI